MDSTRGAGTAVLWLVVLGTLAAGTVAVLVDVPSAALVLAALCAVLAVVRGTDRGVPPAFRARSTGFDVALLVVAAVALAILSPAGNLT